MTKKSLTYGADVDAVKQKFSIWQRVQFFKELFATFTSPDNKPVKVRIKVETVEKTRSLQQLRYYRGVMLIEAQKAWANAGYRYTLDYIDGLMKAEFLYTEIINGKTGDVHRQPWSMSNHGGVTSTGFIEKKAEIQQWYAENLDYNIPDPNEKLQDENNEKSDSL